MVEDITKRPDARIERAPRQQVLTGQNPRPLQLLKLAWQREQLPSSKPALIGKDLTVDPRSQESLVAGQFVS
jgi:hypothetical protein